MLSTRQIEAFRAVMLTRSMTRAAASLSITQPAVSRLIGDLEYEVGFSLFRRRKGGLEPSADAQALFAEVERSFLGLASISRAAERIRNRSAGQLRIAGMPAFAGAFLPTAVDAFLGERSDIAVSVHSHNSPNVVELVRAQHYDVGFAMTPVDSTGVKLGPVRSARCVCLLPPGHRLVAKAEVCLEDLRDEPYVSLSETMTRFRVDAAFQAANVTRRLMIEARWSVTVCRFVALGRGVSIVEPFTAHYADHGAVVRPLREEIDFSFTQVQPLHQEERPLLAEFLATMEACLQPYLV